MNIMSSIPSEDDEQYPKWSNEQCHKWRWLAINQVKTMNNVTCEDYEQYPKWVKILSNIPGGDDEQYLK